jgi:hypothetical protein
MRKQSICERERSQLEKLKKFQLGYQYKKVGLIVAIVTFIVMISMKYIDEPTWVRPLLHGVLLIGLLLISVSKEKLEDEFLESLRSQSYRLAFILAIVYSLVQPLVNFGVATLLKQDDALEGFSYFQVLFFMLIVQLLFFWKLKRTNK